MPDRARPTGSPTAVRLPWARNGSRRARDSAHATTAPELVDRVALHDRLSLLRAGDRARLCDCDRRLARRPHVLRRLRILHIRLTAPARPGAECGDDARTRTSHLAWCGRGVVAARSELAGGSRPQFPGTLAFNVSTLFALSTSLTAAQAQRVVWRPDFVGSTLFLTSSTLAILALGNASGRYPWRIAWLNMVGSVAFMASAIASLVLPATGRRSTLAGRISAPSSARSASSRVQH